MDAFGRRRGEHVREMLAEELADVTAGGAVPVNGNHGPKSTCCARLPRCAKIPLIVTRLQEVRPMNAVSVMGAPLKSTILRLN
jgi:hypothetical protein